MKKLKLNYSFDLDLTINSGQIFLFEKIKDTYYIVNGENIFKVKQKENYLYFDNISKKKIIDFFNLEFNLDEFYSKEKNKILIEIYKKYRGLNIINQDFFMCLICFIGSQNNSIKRNTKSLKKMCELLGDEKIIDNKKMFTFPKPNIILKNKQRLKKCFFGYRENYIIRACEKILNEKNFILKINKMDFENSKISLLKFVGIGEKVCECITLFSLKHYSSFPKDVWIRKSLDEIFCIKNKSDENLFIQDLGEFRGLKQQYIFEHMRRL